MHNVVHSFETKSFSLEPLFWIYVKIHFTHSFNLAVYSGLLTNADSS